MAKKGVTSSNGVQCADSKTVNAPQVENRGAVEFCKGSLVGMKEASTRQQLGSVARLRKGLFVGPDQVTDMLPEQSKCRILCTPTPLHKRIKSPDHTERRETQELEKYGNRSVGK